MKLRHRSQTRVKSENHFNYALLGFICLVVGDENYLSGCHVNTSTISKNTINIVARYKGLRRVMDLMNKSGVILKSRLTASSSIVFPFTILYKCRCQLKSHSTNNVFSFLLANTAARRPAFKKN